MEQSNGASVGGAPSSHNLSGPEAGIIIRHWRDLPLHEGFFYKYTQIYIAPYIKVYWCHIVHIYKGIY